jgi:hypothetical protein
MKIGRNQKCPCGSGKKYKKCCLNAQKKVPTPELPLPADVLDHARQALRLNEAAEKVRLQQQGHGRPIFSLTFKGFRIVSVGNTLHWSKNWLVFPDFLLAFLKKSLGREWGTREKENGQHPIFRWLKKFKDYSDSQSTDGRLRSAPLIGCVACWLHLGYSLYLIAHHDQLPKRLLKRLRAPLTFMPAYYEAIVGAALAVAGFEIASVEIRPTSSPTPEFTAKSKATGTVYEVEAKRKDHWTAPTHDIASPAFLRELEAYVRDQVHAASKKRLRNPVYWLELSIPTLEAEAEWRAIGEKVKAVLRDAENSMTVAGNRIQPAFVVITNHTSLANEDVVGDPSFAFLETLNVADYPFGRAMELEAALEAYDKYRDIFSMMEAWKIARTVPTTFDGTPPELLSADGEPQKTIRIGDMMLVPGPDGNDVPVRVEEIASLDQKAAVAVHDPATDRHWLVEMPLTEGEAAAAAKYTDAIFGKSNTSRQLRDDDPTDLYDWLLDAYAESTLEQVNKLMNQDAGLRQYIGLSLPDARKRIAREYTKRMWAMSQAKKKSKPQS